MVTAVVPTDKTNDRFHRQQRMCFKDYRTLITKISRGQNHEKDKRVFQIFLQLIRIYSPLSPQYATVSQRSLHLCDPTIGSVS